MEARRARVLFALLLAPALMGATYQSKGRNFTVTAPTPEIARQVGETAEIYRKQLAMEWLGYELPRWSAPCPVRVNVGQIGAGGQTTFSFFPNSQGSAEVCNWDMQIQGSLERIRECPGQGTCGWLFLDLSKNASRRWCDMRVCGNRAKARRHYARTLPPAK